MLTFLKENLPVNEMISEFSKLIKILLTIPATSCTSECSFSTLWILKTFVKIYLKLSMGRSHLN